VLTIVYKKSGTHNTMQPMKRDLIIELESKIQVCVFRTRGTDAEIGCHSIQLHILKFNKKAVKRKKV
jgi:hypothetical protein